MENFDWGESGRESVPDDLALHLFDAVSETPYDPSGSSNGVVTARYDCDDDGSFRVKWRPKPNRTMGGGAVEVPKIKGPGILPEKVIRTDNGWLTVSPYYEGFKTLKEYRGRLSRSAALNVIAQIARAVAVVNEHGFFVGDLKPENVRVLDEDRIVLSRSEAVQLFDFEGIVEEGLRARADQIFHTTGFRVEGPLSPWYLSADQPLSKPFVLHRGWDTCSIALIAVDLLHDGEISSRHIAHWAGTDRRMLRLALQHLLPKDYGFFEKMLDYDSEDQPSPEQVAWYFEERLAKIAA